MPQLVTLPRARDWGNALAHEPGGGRGRNAAKSDRRARRGPGAARPAGACVRFGTRRPFCAGRNQAAQARCRDRLRRRRRGLPLRQTRRSGTRRPGRDGYGAPDRRNQARYRRHRLQHRVHPRAPSLEGRLCATPVRGHRPGDQACGGGVALGAHQRLGDARHRRARLYSRARARTCRQLRGDAGRRS